MTYPKIQSPLLVYMPAFNCSECVADLIREIPLVETCPTEVLLIDNCSPDRTAEITKQKIAKQPVSLPVHIIRTTRNLGYAGSQKMAYEIALANPQVKNVVMLHADGQYPPEMLHRFISLCDGSDDIVYGYRSKIRFFKKEETPWTTFIVIRLLSIFESLVTFTFIKEWHTGFVMYKTEFLAKVPFQILTTTPHIDGHLLFTGKHLGAKIRGIPIYKRYKNLVAFSGLARVRYVIDVFKLMFSFDKNRLKNTKRTPLFSDRDFSVIM